MMRPDVCTLLKAQTEVIKDQQEPLDDRFLTELGRYIRVYTMKKYDPKFPKKNLPENHEMSLLLNTIRQTNNINAKNESGHTLLSLVAYTSEREFLEFLLACPQIDVNVQNNQKNTPLMRVILRGRDMKLMLEPILAHESIDLEIRSSYGEGGSTPLMLAESLLQQEKDEIKRAEYMEIISLLKAKETELAKKSKRSSTFVDTTKNSVSNIVK